MLKEMFVNKTKDSFNYIYSHKKHMSPMSPTNTLLLSSMSQNTNTSSLNYNEGDSKDNNNQNVNEVDKFSSPLKTNHTNNTNNNCFNIVNNNIRSNNSNINNNNNNISNANSTHKKKKSSGKSFNSVENPNVKNDNINSENYNTYKTTNNTNTGYNDNQIKNAFITKPKVKPTKVLDRKVKSGKNLESIDYEKLNTQMENDIQLPTSIDKSKIIDNLQSFVESSPSIKKIEKTTPIIKKDNKSKNNNKTNKTNANQFHKNQVSSSFKHNYTQSVKLNNNKNNNFNSTTSSLQKSTYYSPFKSRDRLSNEDLKKYINTEAVSNIEKVKQMQNYVKIINKDGFESVQKVRITTHI